jgi:hypothetical protein
LNHNLTDKYDTNINLIGHWDYDGKGRVITYYSHLENGVAQNRIDLSYGLVCCNRDKEKKEIRERMAKGVIGAEIFQQNIEKRARKLRRPKRGRPRK